MKRGFTLIELLAVIVILAIIALIAVPIVINIINDAKEESTKRSINNYLDAVVNTITQENLKVKYNPDECIIQKNGNIICSEKGNELITANGTNNLEIQIKGKKPNGGTIQIKNGKVIDITDIVINNKFYSYDSKGNIISSKIPALPGLYDKNYNLIASWDELVNDYQLDVTKNQGSAEQIEYNENSLGSILYQKKFENVRHLIISKNVTSIGNYAFSGCLQLESIRIEHSNPKYEDRGSNAIIEKSTNTLVAGIKTTVIPTSVTKIGPGAFAGFYHNLDSITIPSSVTNIDDYAFSFSSLTSIIIPNSVTSIGIGTFSWCTKLKTVNFENNSKLESIGEDAFSITPIDSITIPASVKSIGLYAFSITPSLVSVIFEDPYDWYVENSLNSSFDNSIDVTNSATNATNLRNTYKGKYWIKESTLPGGLYDENNNLIASWDELVNDYGMIVSYDDEYEFEENEKLLYEILDENEELGNSKILVIQKGITSIGDGAFEECTNLTDIIIPSTVTSIGNSAFYDCTSLRNIEFKNSSKLKTIEEFAFVGCNSLTSIIIPIEVDYIGFYAFEDCNNLISATFKNKNGWNLYNDNDELEEQELCLDNIFYNADVLVNYYVYYYLKRV